MFSKHGWCSHSKHSGLNIDRKNKSELTLHKIRKNCLINAASNTRRDITKHFELSLNICKHFCCFSLIKFFTFWYINYLELNEVTVNFSLGYFLFLFCVYIFLNFFFTWNSANISHSATLMSSPVIFLIANKIFISLIYAFDKIF